MGTALQRIYESFEQRCANYGRECRELKDFEFPPAPQFSIKVQWCAFTLKRMVLGERWYAWLHFTLAKPSEGEVGHYWQEVPSCSHLARHEAAPASTPPQCQPAQRETNATPQAAAERFIEKVAAKGANIISSLQPLWMALPVQHRGCFEWQSTGSESSYNHCWCVPASVYHQAFLWVK